MKNEFTNGRKGCSGCYSESNELMQFDGFLPTDCEHFPVFGQVLPERNDFKEVLQPDLLLVLAA
jgi:hypothetical protein